MEKDPVSEECMDLIRSMMAREPRERPDVDKILAHPWLVDAPEYSTEQVFNESERAIMIKEYFFPENEEKWSKFIDFDPVEMADYHFFDDRLCTESDGPENISECSLILSPNVTK